LGRSLDETDDSEAIYQQEMAFFKRHSIRMKHTHTINYQEEDDDNIALITGSYHIFHRKVLKLLMAIT